VVSEVRELEARIIEARDAGDLARMRDLQDV
jgi:hypothetical protein